MLLNKHTYAVLRIEKTEESKELERKAAMELSAIKKYKKSRLFNIVVFDIMAMLCFFLLIDVANNMNSGIVMCIILSIMNIMMYMKASKKFKEIVKKNDLRIDEDLQSITEREFSNHLMKMFENQMKEEKLNDCTTLKHSLTVTEDYYDIMVKYH